MGNMADAEKKTESKTDEIKEKFEDRKETLKEKLEDCKEKASERMDAVKEKASEVVKAVKGETEEEAGSRILVAFALLGAWGSGYLAHRALVKGGGDAVLCLSTSSGALLLGGENLSALNFCLQINSFPRCVHHPCLGRLEQPIQEEEVDAVTRPLVFFSNLKQCHLEGVFLALINFIVFEL